MSAEITCYLDCVSPYSYFALLHLERNRQVLGSHDVEIDFYFRPIKPRSRAHALKQSLRGVQTSLTKNSVVPVFLGGINVGSGNKPPWTLPAKAAYSKFDSARAKRHFGVPNHPDAFIQTFLDLFSEMWEHGVDVSSPESLAQVLSKRFDEAQVKEILSRANSAEYKQALNDNTKKALERGAFGCPWYWVRNSKGEEEPFFGSDRFHFMWQYLELPWKDVEVFEPGKAKI